MRWVASILLLLALGAASPRSRASLAWLGPPEQVAPGVDLYRLDRSDLVTPPAPQSVRLLRLDPARVRLVPATAAPDVPGRATVADIARRGHAIAAVNAGFFSPVGDPVGVLRIDGRLVSDTARARGAVALLDGPAGPGVRFDQVTATVRLRFRSRGQWRTVRVDGVDAPRGSGRLVLYSPGSGATTDTTGGLEWTLTTQPRPAPPRPGRPASAAPMLTVSGPSTVGNTAIPRDGYVLSFGATRAPASLAGLGSATAVQVRETLTVASGQHARDWIRAPHIVGGAGLLMRQGALVTDWTRERLSTSFATRRHPRTLIARDAGGALWLVTVDGRQSVRSVGMTFAELHALLTRLRATDALNLDGGGSTTMVVNGVVVNVPSDVTGPRPVSDALLVLPR